MTRIGFAVLQFAVQDWVKNFNEVGIGEMRKLSSVVKNEKVKDVFERHGANVARCNQR